MSDVKIRLTTEQQKQIKDATGKTVSELVIDQALTMKELGAVAGGTVCFTSKVRE
jgi:hypothetical protein